MSRQYAREQRLPPQEVELLGTLTQRQLKYRAKQLFDVGWTLQAIGAAFSPPYGRSTIQYWVKTASQTNVTQNPVPTPWEDDAPPNKGYQRKTPPSPGIPPQTQEQLAQLSSQARLFRSGMASTSLPALANEEFNSLIQSLYNEHVTVSEIARASNVTNRAIARRLGK